MKLETSRRSFLKGAAAAGAALIVGVRADGAIASPTEGGAFNPFVRITADGRAVAIIKHFEMGQGPTTGLTTLIAEELGVTMDQIDYAFAPSDPNVYNNLFFGKYQGTGGSTAMANSFMQYRKAGAAAREMLINAAAAQWGAAPDALDIVAGEVVGAGRKAPIAKFVEAAAQLETPAEPRLRAPEEWRLIGKETAVKRKDTPAKVNGAAQFAMDVQLEGQIVASIVHAPSMGANVTSFDDGAAQGVKGFIMARALPDASGVAIYAQNTWSAFQARDAVSVVWDDAEAETRSSDEIKAELIAAVGAPSELTAQGDPQATAALIGAAQQVIDKTFYFPLLAHAPMEPLTCTIEPTADGGVILHDGAQFPTTSQTTLSRLLNLPLEKVQVNTVLAGGSFGRRVTPTSDYNAQCAMAFAMTDRTRPVKLVWSREDDIKGGYYRPAFAHRVRVGLDGDGQIVGWDHRIAGPSILTGTFFEQVMVHDGVDHTSVEGVMGTPYAAPGLAVGVTNTKKATSVLWWRSVGHTHTAYVMESMLDIVAQETGRDPLQLRLSMLPGETPQQTRLAGVLRKVAEIADFSAGAAEGRSYGLAAHYSFGSYVAQIVEVSGGADAPVRVEKVYCAVDCGVPVNPDVIRAQMEGGVGFGLGHVMRNQITLTQGETDQSNFPDYEPLRISDIQAIEVAIVPSALPPSGVGEPGVPPAGPALANAIARNGGPRITETPMNDQVAFA